MYQIIQSQQITKIYRNLIKFNITFLNKILTHLNNIIFTHFFGEIMQYF